LAHDKLSLLQDQKERLERWWKQPIQGHRAHFYRFAYPRSWAWQFRAGLQYDASLGYPDLPGLRSIHLGPINFSDPEYGLVPFVTLPTVLLDQHFFWPEPWPQVKFENYISHLLERVIGVGGVLTLDWHSYTIEQVGYGNWWTRLAYILELAQAKGAYLAGIGQIIEHHRSRWAKQGNGVQDKKLNPTSFDPNQSYYEQDSLWRVLPDPYQIQTQAAILDLIPVDVKSILDVGCGDGFITEALPQDSKVVGFDFSREALRNLGRDACLGTTTQLPFPSGSFDLVMANDVLEHIPEAEYATVLTELQRVAAKYIIVTLPHAEDLEARQTKCASCGTLYHVNHHQRVYDKETMINLFGKTGIKPVEIRLSGAVTRPPLDPTTAMRRGLGCYHSWSKTMCPQCGSKQQVETSENSFLINLLDSVRSVTWARLLREQGPWTIRTESMALYSCGPQAQPGKRQQRQPAVTQESLLDIDFSNPLQIAWPGFTAGMPWARFHLPSEAKVTAQGLIYRSKDKSLFYIPLRIPTEAQPGDHLTIQVTSLVDVGKISLYGVTGGKELLLHQAHLQLGPNEVNCLIEHSWDHDRFGLALHLYLEGQLNLHRVQYKPINGENKVITHFVALNPGFNVIDLPSQSELSQTWAFFAARAGRLPCVELDPRCQSVAAYSPDPVSPVEILIAAARQFESLQGDYKKILTMLEQTEKQRAVAEAQYTMVEQQYRKLSQSLDDLNRQHNALQQQDEALGQALNTLQHQHQTLQQQANELAQQRAMLQIDYETTLTQLHKRVGLRGSLWEFGRNLKRRLLGQPFEI
jgi:hypothetical protein